MRAEPGLVLLTGGQTGVDTLAARAALGAGLAVHLAFPLGLRQEDGPISPERLGELDGAVLHELLASEFSGRTWACVGLADVVVLIDPAGGDGCAETVRAAGEFGRPLLDLTGFVRGSPERVSAGLASPGLASPGLAPTAVRDFLSRNSPQVVLFAGCRGSLLDSAGATDAVAEVLDAVMCDGLAGGRPGRPSAGPWT